MACLSRQTISLDLAVSRTGREIALLHEYRTRLIADVVTGKLDVLEAPARMPEEAGEPELSDEAEDSIGAQEWLDDDLTAASEEDEA